MHIASCKFAKDNNIPMPTNIIINIPFPCLQISLIKSAIISIVPETKFIDYEYESPVPLDSKDFVEIFIDDHCQCIEKVETTIEKLKIK